MSKEIAPETAQLLKQNTVECQLETLNEQVSQLGEQLNQTSELGAVLIANAKQSGISLNGYVFKEALENWKQTVIRKSHQALQTILAEGPSVSLPSELSHPYNDIDKDFEAWSAVDIARKFATQFGEATDAEHSQTLDRIGNILQYATLTLEPTEVKLVFPSFFFETNHGEVRLGYSEGAASDLNTLLLLYRFIKSIATNTPFVDCNPLIPPAWLSLKAYHPVPSKTLFKKEVIFGVNVIRIMATRTLVLTVEPRVWQALQNQLPAWCLSKLSDPKS